VSRDVIASIDRAAFQHNFNLVRKLTAGASIWAMIKSSGYGHGLLRTAKWLTEVDALGVACVEEALALRRANIIVPIFVMAGFLDETELRLFEENNIGAVIHHGTQLQILENYKFSKPLNIWLKIDTGMHRLGFAVEEFDEVYDRLQKISAVQKPFGIMTHLADADNKNKQHTENQIRQFLKVTKHIDAPKSIANSAGILAYSHAHANWVRPGIILYGVSPFADRTGQLEGLKPVMTLTAKLIAKKILKKNNFIGYGCTWSAPEDMPVGMVAVGYGDGYPRHAVSGTPTLIKGKICPLVGRVSMDIISIDLRSYPDAKVGDTVTLWGEGLPIEKVAAYADTIGYGLLCGVTQRVRYVEK